MIKDISDSYSITVKLISDFIKSLYKHRLKIDQKIILMPSRYLIASEKYDYLLY